MPKETTTTSEAKAEVKINKEKLPDLKSEDLKSQKQKEESSLKTKINTEQSIEENKEPSSKDAVNHDNGKKN